MDYQSENVTLRQGLPFEDDITIQVDLSSGSVEVQIEDASGAFYTPTGDEFTISTRGSYVMERSNRPRTRFVATGDAQFKIIGGLLDD